VSGWTSQDKALIAKSEVTSFGTPISEWTGERDECPYEVLKQALVERFSDKLPDHYYTQLQEAVQGKDEGAEEFGDR
jgi:hypothetical protein